MFYCCIPSKDPAETALNVDAPSIDFIHEFTVCPQLFFSHFSKLIFFKFFLNFKNNFKERNSKKNRKINRIKKEIQILKFIHSGKHNYML
tara:strand:+ start:360 stop:629 length:270 start_codon:yes stop_codon:yes gene_type:complete